MLGGSLTHKGASIIYCQREIERSNLQLHPPSLNFGEIENLVNEGQQVAALRRGCPLYMRLVSR
jgi:hypothetical protein